MGNTLIAESYGRRAFEVTQDGKNVWEYVEDSARIQGAYRYAYDHCPQLAILPKPESTEGGRLVSILKWPEGAPLNLG